jgi:molybdopterin molybdotransferase
MIDVSEGLSLVLERAEPLPPVRSPLGESLGLVLAEDAISDIDSPPYDKALMDGYAVIAADVQGGTVELQVIEEVTAGDTPRYVLTRGQATRLMTGAPLPAGADAVVASERTEGIARRVPIANRHGQKIGDFVPAEATVVRILDPLVQPGQNIMRRGTSLRCGETVLPAGRVLNAVDIGVASEAGCVEALVYPRPRVAVLATGNELVPPGQKPGAGEIRNSNGPMLCALASQAGGIPVDLGIGRDDRGELSRWVTRGLQEDVLVLSGGVSAGILDLVPQVLADLGVEEVFHKVRLKPGKPLWFGVWTEGGRRKLVFGLPGNPVSTLVCFQLFVRPALQILAGHRESGLPPLEARLAKEFTQRGDRQTYFPARLRRDGGQAEVELLGWQGSADLRTLAHANCLAIFPSGPHRFEPGTTVNVLPLE